MFTLLNQNNNPVSLCVADRGLREGLQAVHVVLQAGDAPAAPGDEQRPHQAHPSRGRHQDVPYLRQVTPRWIRSVHPDHNGLMPVINRDGRITANPKI